jgi:hypothetical protein
MITDLKKWALILETTSNSDYSLVWDKAEKFMPDDPDVIEDLYNSSSVDDVLDILTNYADDDVLYGYGQDFVGDDFNIYDLATYLYDNIVSVYQSDINESRKLTSEEREVFLYLNELRDSGVTNMYGAVPYIMAVFPHIEKAEAVKLLTLWMKNFNPDGDYDVINENSALAVLNQNVTEAMVSGTSFINAVEAVNDMTNIFNLLYDEGYINKNGDLEDDVKFDDVLNALLEYGIHPNAKTIDELKTDLFEVIDVLEQFKK